MQDAQLDTTKTSSTQKDIEPMLEEEDDPSLTVFYKYRSGIDESGHNLSLITEQKAYFGGPESFNDPFDCAPVPSQCTAHQVAEVWKRIENNNDIPEREKALARHALETNSKEIFEYIREKSGTPEYVAEFVRGYSVYCVSKSPVNRLLWAHYGGDHKGFAIELDVRCYLEHPPWEGGPSTVNSFIPLPVTYSDERPILEMSGASRARILTTKDSCWSYEDEHRVVRNGSPGLVDVDPRCIASVILGARASQETALSVEQAVTTFNREHAANVKVYRAALSSTLFRLNVPDHPLHQMITYP